MKTKKRLIQIDPRKIKTDPFGDELTNSAQMKPYIDFFVAAMTKEGVDAALQRVAALKLNARYVWRGFGLDCAFADSDSETARLDWTLMSEEERAEPRQTCSGFG